MNPGFPDILAMPPDMRYTIGRQKEISISILNSEKPRRSRLRGFSYLLGAGRSNLRMATSLLSVHPFADVVGYYACRNREYKGNQPIHAEHPLPLPVWGWQPVPYNMEVGLQQGKPDFALLRLKITARDIFTALDPCRANGLFIIYGCSQPTGISSINRLDGSICRTFFVV